MKDKLLTHAQCEWAYEKWCEGYTMEEIADCFQCSPRTISRTAIHGRPKIKKLLKYDYKNG